MTQSEVIVLESVSKRYRLGEFAPYETLREAVASRLRPKSAAESPAQVWALRDIDLTIAQGEAVGIVGRNGAGKSTLLRVVAGITRPTMGVARVRGRVGALLEVGTGFHPELTGRENVVLNGVLLGMSRAEVSARFDEIVSFAGVQRFIDTPLKRWSTGMTLRLAFAVGAHLEPDVLVVDEVLATGDAEFQRRCLQRLSDLEGEGRTILFVSHDVGAVARICDRALWIDHGEVRADGAAGEVVRQYLRDGIDAVDQSTVDLAGKRAGPIRLEAVLISGEAGTAPPRRDQHLTITLRFAVEEVTPDLDFALWIVGEDGRRLIDDTWSDTRLRSRRLNAGERYEVAAIIPPLLRPGDYVVGAWIGTEGTQLRYLEEELARFTIESLPTDREEALQRRRLVSPPVRWELTPC